MKRYAVAAAVAVILVGAVLPLGAQDIALFDPFNFKFESSRVRLNTMMRIDSSSLETGAELSFENDLGLGDKESIPTVAFEWQFFTKHRLAVRWQDIDRDSSTQVLEEIRIGDEIISIDTDLGLGFEVETWAIDYTYYPWIRDRWAAGFGFGVRIMDIITVFTADGTEVDADGSVTAPLPYVNFEYRRIFGDKWRMRAGLGWLAVTYRDIDGNQWIGRLSMEHQTFSNVGFGLGINYSTIDVESQGDEFKGKFDMDIDDISLYVRVHF